MTDPAAIRVVLCDDHPAMRAAFRMILEASDIAVVGEAGDGDAAVAVVALERPDVVLMDVRMPGRDGISAIAEIVSTFPQCRVLVLRRSTTTCSMALDRSVAARVFARFAVVAATPDVSTVHSSALDRLTERERDVLWLMAQGMTNLEIAHRLDVAEATVKTHVSRLLTELAVRDRVQAVIHAYRSGFARVDRRLG